ncbi:Transmembrane protein 230 [Mytilus edulis]|uniref:Transmembrane protein 230 n=1 Tax=Mytilus edulis TaxID=6550 RepID=A0A8S3TXN3_MYTED|nr:Transmembrane protein 230 [Mytilus edulis]
MSFTEDGNSDADISDSFVTDVEDSENEINRPGNLRNNQKPVSKQEISAFFGLLLAMGIIMSRNRFQEILRFLHCNDNALAVERGQAGYDPLHKVANIIEFLTELLRRKLQPYKRSALRNVDDGFIDLQFQRPPPKIPYKAISLATVLFVIGTVLLVIGSMLLTVWDRTWPVIILGAIMFIPGAYHVRLACYAYKGYDGYSYDDIPEFDE